MTECVCVCELANSLRASMTASMRVCVCVRISGGLQCLSLRITGVQHTWISVDMHSWHVSTWRPNG